MIPVADEIVTADARAIYKRSYLLGLKPDPKLLVSEWADQYRMLTSRSSPEPGPWRTERTPDLREIMGSRTEMVVFAATAGKYLPALTRSRPKSRKSAEVIEDHCLDITGSE
jgi:hypothetical protein